MINEFYVTAEEFLKIKTLYDNRLQVNNFNILNIIKTIRTKKKNKQKEKSEILLHKFFNKKNKVEPRGDEDIK